MAVEVEPVDRSGQRTRVGGVAHQEREREFDLDLAAMTTPIGHEAVVRSQQRLEHRRVDLVVGIELAGTAAVDRDRLDQVEHDEAALEPAPGVADPPRRATHGALLPEARQRAEIAEHLVEPVDGTADRTADHPARHDVVGERRAQFGQMDEDAPRGDRQELPHRRRLGEEGADLDGDGIGQIAERLAHVVERGLPLRQFELAVQTPTSHGGERSDRPTRPVAVAEVGQPGVLLQLRRGHPEHAGHALRPLRRPVHPVERVGGAGRHRSTEVDLRQPRGAHHRDAVSGHPDILGERTGRQPRVVASGQYAPGPTGQHADPFAVVDRVEPHDHRRTTESVRFVRRHDGQFGERSPRAEPADRLLERTNPLDRGIQVRLDPRNLDDTGSVRVGERHTTRADGLEEPGHAHRAARSGRQRVDRRIVEPPEEHVDRFEPAQGAEEDPALTHDEIGALHQVEPELDREVRVIDVRRMVEAGREHDGPRARRRRHRRQRATGGPGEPADRGDVDA